MFIIIIGMALQELQLAPIILEAEAEVAHTLVQQLQQVTAAEPGE